MGRSHTKSKQQPPLYIVKKNGVLIRDRQFERDAMMYLEQARLKCVVSGHKYCWSGTKTGAKIIASNGNVWEIEKNGE